MVRCLIHHTPLAFRSARPWHASSTSWLVMRFNIAGFRRNAIEPSADRRECGKLEVALMREVRIGIERDVGDGIAPRREIAMMLKVLLHDAQRSVPLLHPVFQGMPPQVAAAFNQREPEIGRAHIGIEAM